MLRKYQVFRSTQNKTCVTFVTTHAHGKQGLQMHTWLMCRISGVRPHRLNVCLYAVRGGGGEWGFGANGVVNRQLGIKLWFKHARTDTNTHAPPLCLLHRWWSQLRSYFYSWARVQWLRLILQSLCGGYHCVFHWKDKFSPSLCKSPPECISFHHKIHVTDNDRALMGRLLIMKEYNIKLTVRDRLFYTVNLTSVQL